MLKGLSDDIIIESYYKAVDFNLERDFIKILQDVLQSRGVSIAACKITSEDCQLTI